ncbi:hypothetical protein L9F63_011334, partial [Diploptera punctata]
MFSYKSMNMHSNDMHSETVDKRYPRLDHSQEFKSTSMLQGECLFNMNNTTIPDIYKFQYSCYTEVRDPHPVYVILYRPLFVLNGWDIYFYLWRHLKSIVYAEPVHD